MNAQLDFGYPWWLSYGHLVVLAPTAALLGMGLWRGWHGWLLALLGVLVLWSAVAVVTIRFGLNINTVPQLPTEHFLASGNGHVLDMGAGTGRSSIMVLAARPKSTLVALDLFGESFETHFGEGGTPQERLGANLKAAGVDGRASIETGDMRKLPYQSETFDAIVSAYAVDHLGREGISEALAEAARVVKPGGDFLLILIHDDAWSKLLFGPLLMHTTRPPSWYQERLEQAGFSIVEQGSSPITIFFLGRRT